MFARLILITLAVLATGFVQAQVRVIASIPPYGDIVRQLAGDLAEVEVLLPAGASPHTFEPSPRMAARLARADLVVLNGGVDEWLLEMVAAVNPEVVIVEALEVLAGEPGGLLAGGEGGHGLGDDPDAGDDHGPGDDPGAGDDHGPEDHQRESSVAEEEGGGHDHGEVNPHVWLDPTLVKPVATEIARILSRADPDNAAAYLEAGERLAGELATLDEELQEMLEPLAGAPFVPFHDAWPYFAARYGLDLVLEIEPFPGREPSPRYLADVVATLRKRAVPAIFTEVGLSDRPGRVLAAEAGVELYLLDPLGRPGESYQQLLRRNATVISEALGPWARR